MFVIFKLPWKYPASEWDLTGPSANKMKLGKGINGKYDGWIEYNVLASYMHMHFGYDKKLVQNFILSCEKHQRKK